MFVSVCLFICSSVCLCLSVLIQLIIRKHIKVVMAFWHFWQPSSNKLIFIISCTFLYILFVENKFFFFFFLDVFYLTNSKLHLYEVLIGRVVGCGRCQVPTGQRTTSDQTCLLKCDSDQSCQDKKCCVVVPDKDKS